LENYFPNVEITPHAVTLMTIEKKRFVSLISLVQRLDFFLGAEREEVGVVLDQLLEAGHLLLALVRLVRLGERGAPGVDFKKQFQP
jgi:hypothetical protein